MPIPAWQGIGAWLVVISGVTLVAFAIDKRRARLGRWRTRERTLHALELLGGWPAAVLAMRLFHHKTRDRRYRAVQGAIIALHLAGAAVAGWWWLIRPG